MTDYAGELPQITPFIHSILIHPCTTHGLSGLQLAITLRHVERKYHSAYHQYSCKPSCPCLSITPLSFSWSLFSWQYVTTRFSENHPGAVLVQKGGPSLTICWMPPSPDWNGLLTTRCARDIVRRHLYVPLKRVDIGLQFLGSDIMYLRTFGQSILVLDSFEAINDSRCKRHPRTPCHCQQCNFHVHTLVAKSRIWRVLSENILSTLDDAPRYGNFMVDDSDVCPSPATYSYR